MAPDTDLELQITRVAGDYRAALRAEHPTGRAELAAGIPLAIDLAALREHLLDPEAYGALLTDMAFPPELRAAWSRVQGYADGGAPLRLRLALDPHDEPLHAIRWELLRDPLTGRPLAHDERTRLARTLVVPDLRAIARPARPNRVRAALAVASPPWSRLGPIDVAAEVARARGALGPWLHDKSTLDGRDGRGRATLPAIAAALRDGAQILVIVCHGRLVDGVPALWIETDAAPPGPTAGEALADAIAALPQPPALVVLAACAGAGAGDETLAALGPRLVRAGAGAVLAMRDAVPQATVAALLPRFFQELARDGAIDRALAVARAALLADHPRWAPVLWMRLRDGRLWGEDGYQGAAEPPVITAALAAATPPDLHPHLPRLAALLHAGLRDGQLPPGAVEQLAADPPALAAAQALLGQSLEVGPWQLHWLPGRYLAVVTATHRARGDQVHLDLDDLPCPYPGMQAFGPDSARFFYGRQAEIEDAIWRLKAQRRLLVIGPSGSGKSSLVAAGIIPTLRQRERGRLHVVTMRPGSAPLPALAEALGDPTLAADSAADWPAAARRAALAAPAARQLLLVVDQGEELFSQADRAGRATFVAALAALHQAPDCLLILVLRADFYADLMGSPLWPIPPGQRLEVAPLGDGALQEAIAAPAAQLGIALAPGLPELLVRDAADQPGALPLLQETLAQLWDTVTDRRIALAAYTRLGGAGRSGLTVALATAADAALDALAEDEQACARRVLLRLIQFGEGRPDTRRQLQFRALSSAGASPEEVGRVVQHLTSRRLLTLSGDADDPERRVDIAHEALITSWPRLRQWVADQREAERLRRRLEGRVEEWRALGAGERGLLGPAELAEAEAWLARSDSQDLGADPDLAALAARSAAALATIERERVAYQAAQEANRRLSLLAEIRDALIDPLTLAEAPERIADLLVREFAAWGIIEVDLPEHTIPRACAAREELLRASLAAAPPLHTLAADLAPETGLLRITGEALARWWPAGAAALVDGVAHEALIGPIVVDNKVRGALLLAGVDAGALSTPMHALVAEALSRIGLVLTRADLYATIQATSDALGRKVGELSTLLDAARLLSAVLRPDEVLRKLVELVGRQLHVGTVALWAVGDDQALMPAALEGAQTEGWRGMRVPVGQGLIGRVAATLAPLAIDDISRIDDPPAVEAPPGSALASFLGVPVVYRDRVIGVLSVMTADRRQFTDDEMVLLAGLADQAAAALENARLFEERERRISELATINQISLALSASLDEDDLIRWLSHELGAALDAGTIVVGILDSETGTLRYPGAEHALARRPTDPQPGAAALYDRVIQTRRPLLLGAGAAADTIGVPLDDGSADWGDADAESHLVVPINLGNDVIGVIALHAARPNAFDTSTLRLLATVANQAAMAIRNVQLFQELNRSARELTALFEGAQNLAATLDPDEILHLIAGAALRLIGVDRCAVLRLSPDGAIERQVLVGFAGPHPDLSIPFRPDGMTARLIRSGRPLAVSDLTDSESPNSRAVALGVRGVLGVPIPSPDGCLGVIWAGYDRPHRWSDRQIALLSIIANQAAQALKSARLFQQATGRQSEGGRP